MSEKMTTKIKIKYLNTFIAIAIMLGFRYLPAPAPLTPFGMTILGIFIGCIYAWCTTELIWSSIIGLCMLGYTDYCNVTQAFSKAASNPVVLLTFGMFLFASITSACKLNDVIADYIITRKIAKGRPWVLSFVLLMACYVASALTSSIATILICWEFLYTICREVGYKPHDKWPEAMVVGIVYAGAMGFIFFPFKIPVVAIYGFLASAMGLERLDVPFFSYIALAGVFGICCTILYIMMCKYFLRTDVSKLVSVDLSGKEQIKMNKGQKIATALLILLTVLMLLENMLPASSTFGGMLKSSGTVGIAMFVVGLAIFIPHEGKSFMDFKEMANRGLSWDLLFMVGCALTLAHALVVKESGIKAFLMQNITSLMTGGSAFVFIALLLVVAGLLTNFVNSVVVSAVMMPILYSFSQTLGFNPLAVTALFIFVCNMAILLPSSSPYGAMIQGNEWIRASSGFKYCSYAIVMTIAAGIIFGIPLSKVCF